MANHLKFDTMAMDVVYQCTSYRPLYASGGYYYVNQILQLDTNTSTTYALNIPLIR